MSSSDRINVTDENYEKVQCRKCGKELGYVVTQGHKDWIGPECSENGQFEAVEPRVIGEVREQS